MGENIDSTWKQMERYVIKDAFREGAAAGSEASFQTGFDEGYVLGLRQGILLGRARGIAKINNRTTEEINAAASLTAVNCKICHQSPSSKGKTALSDSVYATSYEELKASQLEHIVNLEKLHQAEKVSN